MEVFLWCVYIIGCVLLYVVTSKHDKVTKELIDALKKENDLLVDQNQALRDIIKKYGIKNAN